ncbi:MAG: L-lactate dehydrogenase [Rhodospirillales bacterium]|nr:L-lactate dehydrogenase [Rhodospirillales bacterium]
MRDRPLTRQGNIWEIRDVARRRLPSPLFDFLDGGAEDEWTLRRNIAAYDRWSLLPRTLSDVATIDTTTTVLGHKIDWPVMLAPTGMSRIFHPDGEMAIARAAAKAGTIYTLSTMSSFSMEEVGAVTAAPKWFQVYCFRDRELTREFLTRAKAAGYTGLVVTVDVPVPANRERDRRSGMTIPPKLTLSSVTKFAQRPGWVFDYLTNPPPILANVAHKIAEGSGGGAVSLPHYVNSQFDPSVTWRDIEWMVGQWNGPLIIKGILHPDDARNAHAIGAKAVIISNHGGRQLDAVSGSLDALPRIADAVGTDIELVLDGGIRRGTHVLKALALGAKACMIGRPYLYGLSAGGEAGVRRALTVLRDEVRRDMALVGACTVDEVTRSLINGAV